MKLSSGCTNGGPSSMDGCFCVYVVNTTDALLLFFKQRNLETRTSSRWKHRKPVVSSHAERACLWHPQDRAHRAPQQGLLSPTLSPAVPTVTISS